MSQKRNREAVALIAKMATMTERVFAFGPEVVTAVPIRSLVLGDGANHQSCEQQRQVNDAHLEQVSCNGTAFCFRGCAKNTRKADCISEIKKAEDRRRKRIGWTGHAESPGSKAH